MNLTITQINNFLLNYKLPRGRQFYKVGDQIIFDIPSKYKSQLPRVIFYIIENPIKEYTKSYGVSLARSEVTPKRLERAIRSALDHFKTRHRVVDMKGGDLGIGENV